MIRHYGPTGIFLAPVTMHGHAAAVMAAGLLPERLAGYYHRTLDRPVLDPEDIRGRAVAPALRALFMPAACRVRQTLSSESNLALDANWAGEPVVDLLGYVRSYLRSDDARERPLVVVGHPGAGKSTFARFCVAELASEGALAILVELRAVVATAPVQEQIEQALYKQTGIRTSWSDAAGAHADAQVVVVLDGLDELVNAAGVVQAEYVQSVREFQRRERDNGRPTAMVITSRINALGRTVLPPRTTVARLEPLDDEQVEHWLAVWNHSNETHLRSRGLRTLPVVTVLRYPDLARYPLLLMMLACTTRPTTLCSGRTPSST
ncbi:NACHT domain-containing protein [Micromonospora sp. NPDC051141]|uniref:NACHT domain-containing protein n=1 Tax=Micromonospora sp. NPDC051141 TaxID=3364284 RepID=UPI0037A029D9